MIVDTHNKLRADVRLGLEKRGINGSQPAAEDEDYGIPGLVTIRYFKVLFKL